MKQAKGLKKYLTLLWAALFLGALPASASVFLPNYSGETITSTVHVDLHWHFEFYDWWGLFWEYDTDESFDVDIDVPPGGVQLDDGGASDTYPIYDENGNCVGYRYSTVWATWS